MRLGTLAFVSALAMCPATVAAQRKAPPTNATAECKDGTYSASRTARGACAGHGGVARWLATARCDDGTLSLSTSRTATCANHGGVAAWHASARCQDGTLSFATTWRGACHRRGGVAEWFEERP